MEKRLFMAPAILMDGLMYKAPTPNNKKKKKNTTRASPPSMSACLLVMDDTIKLTEWLAYHYTVLPLSHLIVAIDPASVLTNEIQGVLSLWKPHLKHIEIWTNDTWMILPSDEGWPPGAYDNGTLILKRIERVKSMAHVSEYCTNVCKECCSILTSNTFFYRNADKNTFLFSV